MFRIRTTTSRIEPTRCHVLGGRRRAAFTLVELLLVLAILIVVAAAVWPHVARVTSTHEINQAGMMIQRQLFAARLSGLRYGVPHEFRFECGGRRFLVQPLKVAAQRDAAFSTPSDGSSRHSGHSASVLPSGLRFGEECRQTTARDLWQDGLSERASQVASTQNGWSEPIVFFADGTATNAAFSIRDSRGNELTISIQRLTGGIHTKTTRRIR